MTDAEVVVLPVVMMVRVEPAPEPTGVSASVTDLNAFRHRRERTAEEKAALASPFDGDGE